MEFEKIFAVGANSSIASYLMGNKLFEKDRIFGTVRKISNTEISWAEEKNIYETDFPNNEDSFINFANLLCPMNKERVLLINFIGVFGQVEKKVNLNVADTLNIIDQNLGSFLKLIKFFGLLPSGSMMVSFSGAGVGGDNMDNSSPGYLASKLSIAGLTEVFNRDFERQNKHLALIAPGPFPSPMQEAVALAPPGTVSDISRNKALEVDASDYKIQNLADTLKWITMNPKAAGGRTWSAQFDKFDSGLKTKNYGLLRRITEN